MTIRDWTPRTLRRLWIAAGILQSALLLPWAVEQYQLRHTAPPPPDADSVPGLFAQLDSSERAAALEMLRDSLGIILEVRGDTIAGASLTAEGVALWQPVAAGFGTALESMGVAFMPYVLAALLLLFSPTLAVAVLTALWFRHRSRHALARPDA